jgi:hypothetical protein
MEQPCLPAISFSTDRDRPSPGGTVFDPFCGSGTTPGPSFVFTSAKGDSDPNRFGLLAVRPDWIDNQSILGFVNPITEQCESTQALDLLLRAREAHKAAQDKNAASRYFMPLDEMNLARVEDWLSCTQTRRVTDGPSCSIPSRFIVRRSRWKRACTLRMARTRRCRCRRISSCLPTWW